MANDPGYIYIGGYFHYSGKNIASVLTEKKVGKSINPPAREQALNSTKFTIGYAMLRSWQVDSMSKVEQMLHRILPDRLNGEWFEDKDDTLLSRVSGFMEVYGSTLVSLDISDLDKEEREYVTTNSIRDRISELAGQVFTCAKEGVTITIEVLPNKQFLCKENNKVYVDTPNQAFKDLWGNGKVSGVHYRNAWSTLKNSSGHSMDQELALLK